VLDLRATARASRKTSKAATQLAQHSAQRRWSDHDELSYEFAEPQNASRSEGLLEIMGEAQQFHAGPIRSQARRRLKIAGVAAQYRGGELRQYIRRM
jgi:hypothetical protein